MNFPPVMTLWVSESIGSILPIAPASVHQVPVCGSFTE
jgi:hypothetical protein